MAWNSRRIDASSRAATVRSAQALGFCATFQAATTSDAATTKRELEPTGVTLRIVTLNGATVTSAGASLSPLSSRDPVKLSPGPHWTNIASISGDAPYRRALGYLALEFEAAAGERYTVYERLLGTRFVAGLTDGAGATVSKPSTRERGGLTRADRRSRALAHGANAISRLRQTWLSGSARRA